MTARCRACGVLLAVALATASPVYAQSADGYTFIKVAGDDAAHRDGARAEARLRGPSGVVKDSAGNLYVSDGFTVRKVSVAGMVTTLAGAPEESGTQDGTGAAARFVGAGGIAISATGTIFVADSQYVEGASVAAIRRITSSGTVTTVGTWSLPPYVINPFGIAVDDRDGSVIIANRVSHTIDRMAPDGTITVVAGASGQRGAVDGAAGAARFSEPAAVAVDADGVIYVADWGTHAIRRVGADGVVSTWAGQMGDRGPATNFDFSRSYFGLDGDRSVARFVQPEGLSLDRVTGRMLVATSVVNESRFGFFSSRNRLSQIDADGRVSFFVSVAAQLGFTPVWDGDFAIAPVNTALAAIASDGSLTRVAGTLGGCSPHFSIDGGPLEALFCGVQSVAVANDGAMYVADANCTIRKVAPGGVVTTLAGGRLQPGTADGVGSAARFGGTPSPGQTGCSLKIAVGTSGIVYVADTNAATMRAVAPDGTVTTLAGLAGTPGTADGAGAVARFDQPYDLAIDSSGNLLVADTGSSTIRKVTPAGVVTTVAGTPRVGGSADGTGQAALFLAPWGIAVGPNDTAYIADTGNHIIRRMTSAGVVTTIAGTAGSANTVDGSGAAVRFNAPKTLAADADGNVFVGSYSATIRKITPAGAVSTISGYYSCGTGCTRGYGTVTDVDSAGTLYIPSGATVVVGAVGTTGGAPAITMQPASQTITAGQPATFTVAASGTPAPTYRWQTSADGGATWTSVEDSTTYSGSYSPALAVGSAAVAYPLRRFRAIATSALGLATSDAAVLTVPGLHVTPTSLRFRAVKNGAGCCANTAIQEVQVTFVGVAPAAVQWTSTHPWLWAQPLVQGIESAWKVFVADSYNELGSATSASGTVTLSAPSLGLSAQIAVSLEIVLDPTLTSAPIGQVDTPAQGATSVRGAIGLSGWATDDLGVTGVRIYRNCLDAEPQINCQTGVIPGRPDDRAVFLGNAQLVPGARPDIDAAFPTLTSANSAGWGYLLLTSMLPRTTGTFSPYGGQGPIVLYAVATDRENKQTLLGRNWANDTTPTTITLDNDTIAKPFGSLDTPEQGQRITTPTFNNFGWVLTPDANTALGTGDIEMANTTGLTVFIDGLPVSAVTYNQCRGDVGNPAPPGVYCSDDVSNIFGATSVQAALTTRTSNPTLFRNLDAGRGAIGSAVIDVTLLSNGLHTIAWSATDSAGRVEGIGSRYFSVLRAQTAPATDAAARDSVVLAHPGQVYARPGFGLQTAFTTVTADNDGVRRIRIPTLGRVEMMLGGAVDSAGRVTGGLLGALPVGAHLDHATGHFTWMPGPAFLGTHRLAFIQDAARTDVEVTILATDGAAPGGIRSEDARTVRVTVR